MIKALTKLNNNTKGFLSTEALVVLSAVSALVLGLVNFFHGSFDDAVTNRINSALQLDIERCDVSGAAGASGGLGSNKVTCGDPLIGG